MLKRLWGIKLTRFAAVGVFNTLFDISMLNTFVFVFHIPYVAANLISASISMSASYFLNHHIVFRHKEEHSVAKICPFFCSTGIGILGIQSLMIYAVTHLLQPHHSTIASLIRTLHIFSHLGVRGFELNVAKICAVLAAMVWNFTIYHFVIFKQPDDMIEGDIVL